MRHCDIALIQWIYTHSGMSDLVSSLDSLRSYQATTLNESAATEAVGIALKRFPPRFLANSV